MTLDKPDVLDAIGIDKENGSIVLTIADPWDWSDERAHLLALQAKLSRYFDFIESGQVEETHPDASGRKLVIDVVSRFPLPQVGLALLQRASEASAGLQVEIRHRHHEGSEP